MEATLTAKGQMTLPKAAREHLRVKAGDRVKIFALPDGTVVLLPVRPIASLRGILKSKRGRPVTLEEMDAAIAAGAAASLGIVPETRGGEVRADARKSAKVIGLDSNVLVRYLTQDDPVQSTKATAVLERLTAQDPGYVCHVVLAETAWVLERSYSFSDATVATAFAGLLQATSLVVQEEAAVAVALHTASRGEGTFADALIGVLSSHAGCARTVTFDKRAGRLPGFELL